MKTVSQIKSLITSFLNKKGYILLSKEKYQQDISFYRNASCMRNEFIHDKKIDSIVFSKDRAMQLYAFLESYLQQVNSYGDMYILYKASDNEHNKSYEDLKKLYCNAPFHFIEENKFRSQLLEIISSSTATKIGLYVDDMIFLCPVSYPDILSLPAEEYIVTLSRGKEMNYSVVLQKSIETPDFYPLDNGMWSFAWNQFEYLSDWTYPLGVSGYFYDRDELLVMLRETDFKAPNTLEMSMQRYRPFFDYRKGVCYSTIASCCIHANIVQTECTNPILGDFSIKDLLNEWNKGNKIDLIPFYGKTGKEAEVQKYTFIKRI